MRWIWLLLLLPLPVLAQSNWGQPAAPAPEPSWWTLPVVPGFWMAWTNATAAFFIFVFGCIALMGFLEWRQPGGAPRHGVLGLDTTRGDRLFLTLLGAAYIFLAWLGLVGTPLWGALGLVAAWAALVFWKV